MKAYDRGRRRLQNQVDNVVWLSTDYCKAANSSWTLYSLLEAIGTIATMGKPDPKP